MCTLCGWPLRIDGRSNRPGMQSPRRRSSLAGTTIPISNWRLPGVANVLELDFLPVGKETQSGDAITFRFFDGVAHRIVVVDGGFTETSVDVLSHLEAYYGGTEIDLIVSTHPDDDHIRGLVGVVQGASRVREVWVHQPSSHGYSGSTGHKADLVDELVAAARTAGALVREPFAGDQFCGAVTVAGPSREDYELWLGQETTLDTERMIAKQAAQSALIGALRAKYGGTLTSDPGETLTSGEGTTPRNQHSVILNIVVEGKRALLTGDAGAPALHAAANTLDQLGLSNPYPWVFQVPHHGSRRNLDPEILDRLIGVVGTFDGGVHEAIASVAAKADDHPRGAVSNAMRRRGYDMFATRGRTLHCNSGYPARPNWHEAQSLGWLDENL
jgi:beta-lactamase superfamily II metal-dependent hydrolase